jgi:hypothetical protein
MREGVEFCLPSLRCKKPICLLGDGFEVHSDIREGIFLQMPHDSALMRTRPGLFGRGAAVAKTALAVALWLNRFSK